MSVRSISEDRVRLVFLFCTCILFGLVSVSFLFRGFVWFNIRRFGFSFDLGRRYREDMVLFLKRGR